MQKKKNKVEKKMIGARFIAGKFETHERLV